MSRHYNKIGSFTISTVPKKPPRSPEHSSFHPRMDTSGNGDLDASEFVEGCMRLKGPARSIDVSLLMQEHKRSLVENHPKRYARSLTLYQCVHFRARTCIAHGVCSIFLSLYILGIERYSIP